MQRGSVGHPTNRAVGVEAIRPVGRRRPGAVQVECEGVIERVLFRHAGGRTHALVKDRIGGFHRQVAVGLQACTYTGAVDDLDVEQAANRGYPIGSGLQARERLTVEIANLARPICNPIAGQSIRDAGRRGGNC